MIDPLLLSTAKVLTFNGQQPLTNASGFFFSRDEKLFIVTSGHVLYDEASEHFPDLIRIELHADAENVAEAIDLVIPLYKDGKSIWRQGIDTAASIDVAVIELDRSALPEDFTYFAFSVDHLIGSAHVEIGTPLLVVGFPLGFHDTLHHLPVARLAIVSSAFGLRFQGQGYFLTDARTHRGMSGAPVVMRATESTGATNELPWKLLGIHSARLDMETRDVIVDEALGLNISWYADILETLTEP